MNKKTQAVCLLLASALWARHPSALKPPTWINTAPWAALTVIVHVSKHGEQREFHGPSKFVFMLILSAILYWGGFFGGAQ